MIERVSTHRGATIAEGAPGVRDTSDPPPDDGAPISAIFLVVGFILLVLCAILGFSYWIDRRMHGGVGGLKRIRILRSGELAEATVLSVGEVGLRGEHPRSIVYEVHPASGASFRARGVENLWNHELDLNNVREGARVKVRFDAKDRAVVLLRVDAAAIRRQKDVALAEKEAALLREPPRDC